MTTKNDPETAHPFGEALRSLIARDGRSQSEISAAAGVLRTNLVKVLGGKKPSFEAAVAMLAATARALGPEPADVGRLFLDPKSFRPGG